MVETIMLVYVQVQVVAVGVRGQRSGNRGGGGTQGFVLRRVRVKGAARDRRKSEAVATTDKQKGTLQKVGIP
jgi:hypothetical protein